MKYLSLFSGIEAATVAWHPLGWTPVAFSEIDKFACGYAASMSNSQRYRTLGNSMAVPVIRYIGEKIMEALA